MNQPRRKLKFTDKPGTVEPRITFEIDQIGVYSWSDDPVPGRTPPTAVMLFIDFKADEKPLRMALRLKSEASVNQLIDSLEAMRVDVWKK